MSLARRFLNHTHSCLFMAVVVSIALSLWKIFFSPLVNTDAILYLIATEKLLASGLSESLSVYSWPFFQLVIATLHKITGLPLLTSAQLLMVACFTLVVVAYCRLVNTLGGCRSVLWFALLIILCHPIVNDFRASLIRDPGMIGFVLLALTEQIRLADSGRWRHAALWFGYITVAFLFRVEALAIAALSPLALLVSGQHPLSTRLQQFGKILTIPVLATVAIASISLTAFNEQKNLKVITDLLFVQHNIEQLTSKINALSSVIATQLLGEFSRHDATLVLYISIATITLAGLVRAITLPYLLPLAISWRSPTPALIKQKMVFVRCYALIVFAYLFCFALFVQFSTTRYNLLLSLLLLAPLPFYLHSWWHTTSRQWLIRALMGIAIAVNGLDGLISSEWKKGYIKDATVWASGSPRIANGALITNQPYLGYFSGKSTTDNVLRAINADRHPPNDLIDTQWLKDYVYAYRVKRGGSEALLQRDIETAGGAIFQMFEGADNHCIYVFSVSRDRPRSKDFVGRH